MGQSFFFVFMRKYFFRSDSAPRTSPVHPMFHTRTWKCNQTEKMKTCRREGKLEVQTPLAKLQNRSFEIWQINGLAVKNSTGTHHNCKNTDRNKIHEIFHFSSLLVGSRKWKVKMDLKKVFLKTTHVRPNNKINNSPIYGRMWLLLKYNRSLSFAIRLDLTHSTSLKNSAQRSALTMPHKLEADLEKICKLRCTARLKTDGYQFHLIWVAAIKSFACLV